MKYIPQGPLDQSELLHSLGKENIEELFEGIPSHLRSPEIDYPEALSEYEIRQRFEKIEQLSPQPSPRFAGCGIYEHDIPSVVPYLQSRSEFSTAYTPYQPEISQGLLQYIFEFQSLACQLTESELSNASLYDGATSLAEGLLMALRVLKKSKGKILVTGGLHPYYREVLETYSESFLDRFETFNLKNDRIDESALENRLSQGDIDIFISQSPNVFGILEPDHVIGQLTQKHGCFWISSTMEPVVFGMIRGQGAFGAHIVTAEGQSFGNPPYLGGSTFGFFCTRNEYLRNLPGRLVGETVDEEGKRSFTLTLATREQHIRRGRATSNICTNNNLNMLAGLIHMSCLGKEGLRELALHNYSKAQYLKRSLQKYDNLSISNSPTFNEFVVELNASAASVLEAAEQENWIPGVNLGRFHRHWENKLLIHVNETHSRLQLDQLGEFLGGFS